MPALSWLALTVIDWSVSPLFQDPSGPMSLVPRWRYMTDEAKALTKRTAVSALVVLLVLLVVRALVPWVLVAVVGWWIWKAVSR